MARNEVGSNVLDGYQRDGFVSGIPILTPQDAAIHRQHLERAESVFGSSLHYVNKVHTALKSPLELATHPKLLDIVSSLIGPNILIYNVTFIIKEPMTPTFVSWHQDLTYWGLEGGNQVSAWLALSTADEQSGGMEMIPGSHQWGEQAQVTGDDPNNVLLQSQTIKEVDESSAIACTLAPGQVSLHHGWTVHCSRPNRSADRRIGLNIQYITPDMRQEKVDFDSALLVRGEDPFQFYRQDTPATDYELSAQSADRLRIATEEYQRIAGR